MCTPAVRLVVIPAWAERLPDGVLEAGPEVYPVLALIARQGCVFRKGHGESSWDPRPRRPIPSERRTRDRVG